MDQCSKRWTILSVLAVHRLFYISIYLYIYIYMYVCMYVYIYIYNIYIYILFLNALSVDCESQY